MTFFSQARQTCGTTHFIRPCTILQATGFRLPPNFEDCDVQKNNPFHVTILTQVIIGILDLWNASTYLNIPKKKIVEKQHIDL
jgi:hypothetical protein